MSKKINEMSLTQVYQEICSVYEDLKNLMRNNNVHECTKSIYNLIVLNQKLDNFKYQPYNNSEYKNNVFKELENALKVYENNISKLNQTMAKYDKKKIFYKCLVVKIFKENEVEFNKKSTIINDKLVPAEKDFLSYVNKTKKINNLPSAEFVNNLKQKASNLKCELEPQKNLASAKTL